MVGPSVPYDFSVSICFLDYSQAVTVKAEREKKIVWLRDYWKKYYENRRGGGIIIIQLRRILFHIRLVMDLGSK